MTAPTPADWNAAAELVTGPGGEPAAVERVARALAATRGGGAPAAAGLPDGVCVTVTPTIMDGTVVRWHASEAAMEQGFVVLSASRNGVMSGAGAYIDERLFQAAWAAHRLIARGGDVAHLATHRRAGFLSGRYVAIDSGPGTPR